MATNLNYPVRFSLLILAKDYIIDDGDECYFGLTYTRTLFSGQVTWVLGGPFLRRFYTVYDCNLII